MTEQDCKDTIKAAWASPPPPNISSPLVHEKIKLYLENWLSGVGVLLGNDVLKAVLDCLNNCHIHSKFNHTYVTPVPKVKCPEERISKFRPIHLCNVIYKLVSKVLANRMKKLLPLVVFENQSAFQAGQVVTNNTLMAFENLHYMKNGLSWLLNST